MRFVPPRPAVAALIAIAMVHSDNGVAAAITMTLFAIGVAASVLLILSHDRPFTGEVALTPAPLLEVMPDLSSSTNIEVRPSTR